MTMNKCTTYRFYKQKYEKTIVMKNMPEYTRTYFVIVSLVRSEMVGSVMRLYIPKER